VASIDDYQRLSYNVAVEINDMNQDDVVRARINKKIKEDAATVLATMGLTPSDAYRMMMVRIATDKALPFNPLVPNDETIEAMKAVRRGETTPVSSITDLFTDLDSDD
jgi:DNA-damage-inducible protein J